MEHVQWHKSEKTNNKYSLTEHSEDLQYIGDVRQEKFQKLLLQRHFKL